MSERNAELSYAEVFQILRASKVLILICMLAGGAIAATVAYLYKPVYRADVLLAPASGESGGGSTLSKLAGQFAPLSGLLGGAGGEGLESKEVRLATLSSRRLTETFIKDRNLLPVLFPKRWDAAASRWKGGADGQPPTMDEAFRFFDDKVRSVNEDRRSGLITLSVEWGDRTLVAQWANDLVARSNEYLRQRSIAEAQRSISFLESELQKTNVVERRQIIFRLIESKTGEIMMANARPEYAFAVVDPATVPDAESFVRPRRLPIIVAGLIFGLIVGVAIACILWVRRESTRADRD